MKRPCPPNCGNTWMSWRPRAGNYLLKWVTPPVRTICPASGSAGRTATGRALPSTASPVAMSSPPSFWASTTPPAGTGFGRREPERHPCHSKNNGSSGVGVPLLHHVPRTGDRRPACCRGKSEHHRPGLRPEPLSRPAGKVPGHERPCLVVNSGEQVSFGKKSIRQLLELLT